MFDPRLYRNACSDLSLEFRSQSDVEQEFKFFHCIEVDCTVTPVRNSAHPKKKLRR